MSCPIFQPAVAELGPLMAKAQRGLQVLLKQDNTIGVHCEEVTARMPCRRRGVKRNESVKMSDGVNSPSPTGFSVSDDTQN